MTNPTIRSAMAADRKAVRAIYPLAFPDEDLLALLSTMWEAPADRPTEFVATVGTNIVGHVAYSPCSAEGARVWLLGPLAVHPDHQQQGLGTALIRAGAGAQGGVILVLGDPAYYSRHGFRTETAIQPPYALPQEWLGAWQSIGADGALTGTLSVPEYWRDPALWGR